MFRQFSRCLLEGEVDAPVASSGAPAVPEQQPQEPPEEGEADWPGKKHMTARINRLAKENSELKAAEAKRAEDARKAEEAARQKKLVDKGEYEKALAERDRRIEEMEKRHTAEKRELELRAGLSGLNSLALAGAIAGLKPDDDIGEYIEKIKKENKDLFGDASPRTPPGAPPSDKGGSPTGLKDRAANGDVNAQREIFNRVLEGKPY
jgi:hypothetical protein